MTLPDIPTLRAAWWTLRAARSAHRTARRGIESIEIPSVPVVPEHAGRGVSAVLRRRSDTCLVQAVVLQAWHASQGRDREIIIGVTAPSQGFRAHAWLDGDPPCHDDSFEELMRVPTAKA